MRGASLPCAVPITIQIRYPTHDGAGCGQILAFPRLAGCVCCTYGYGCSEPNPEPSTNDLVENGVGSSDKRWDNRYSRPNGEHCRTWPGGQKSRASIAGPFRKQQHGLSEPEQRQYVRHGLSVSGAPTYRERVVRFEDLCEHTIVK